MKILMLKGNFFDEEKFSVVKLDHKFAKQKKN